MPDPTIIIHNCGKWKNVVKAVKVEFVPGPLSCICFQVTWPNRDRKEFMRLPRGGKYQVELSESLEGEVHFDLVAMNPNPSSFGRVGLRRRFGGKSDLMAPILWADSTSSIP